MWSTGVKSYYLMCSLYTYICTIIFYVYVIQHKREEYVNAKKAAEEAKILKQKAIQREKVNMVTAELEPYSKVHVSMLDFAELPGTG